MEYMCSVVTDGTRTQVALKCILAAMVHVQSLKCQRRTSSDGSCITGSPWCNLVMKHVRNYHCSASL